MLLKICEILRVLIGLALVGACLYYYPDATLAIARVIVLALGSDS
jgi:hypothetical protein